MKRVKINPREHREKKVEAIGLIYHHTVDRPYWNESAYYSFRASEIDRIELATNELHQMCLQAAQHIIDHERFKELSIPETAVLIIKQAWDDEPPDVENREDLMTVTYLMDLAGQTGMESMLPRLDDVAWDEQQHCFVDLDGRPIRSIYELDPWVWLVRDPYANQLLSTYSLTHRNEPIWKMLLSNKGISPILWELFPAHPKLLECHFNEPKRLPEYENTFVIAQRRQFKSSPTKLRTRNLRTLWHRRLCLSSHGANPELRQPVSGHR